MTIRSLCREHRGSANLDSARRNGGFARTKLKPFSKKESRFCKPRFSAHRQQLCTSPIKSFRRPVSPHMVALLTSVRNSPCFGGLRRTKTCHWQLFARPSVLIGYFFHAAKSNNSFPCRELRGFANLDSAHRNCGFALTKLKPFPKEIRGFANLESAHTDNNFPLTKLNPLPLRGSVPAGTARSACFFRRPWWHFSAAPPLFSSTKSRAKKLFRLTAVSLPGRHTPCAF